MWEEYAKIIELQQAILHKKRALVEAGKAQATEFPVAVEDFEAEKRHLMEEGYQVRLKETHSCMATGWWGAG